jgi:hypothetical protein
LIDFHLQTGAVSLVSPGVRVRNREVLSSSFLACDGDGMMGPDGPPSHRSLDSIDRPQPYLHIACRRVGPLGLDASIDPALCE